MVIGAFPTNNSYSSIDVINRWNFITRELDSFGITCSFSSDADPRLLGAMKSVTSFGDPSFLDNLDLKVMCDINSKMKCIQDPIHLTNNLKNRLYDGANDLQIGDFLATINHIQILVNLPNVSKDQHKLTYTDVNATDKSRDKMNSESTKKICTEAVINLLEQNVVGSEGTVAYLKLIRAIYNSFIELETSPLDRLYYGYLAVSFVRIWRNNISGNMKDNFITNSVWTSIEMNFVYLLELVMKGEGHLIVIWNSQTCEELFRTLRSLSTFGLTQINFTMLEAFEKINRVRKIQDIAFDLREAFMLVENEKLKSDRSYRHRVPSSEPSSLECQRVLKIAREDAQRICTILGMKNIEECPPEKYLKSLDYHFQQQGHSSSEEIEEASSGIIQIKNLKILDERSGKS